MSNHQATRDLGLTGQRRQPAKWWPSHSRYFTAAVTSWPFPKCSLELTTDLVFLGVSCDTAQRSFYVPEDKLRKLEAILWNAIDSRSIPFSQLEKLAGKFTSVSFALPPTSLYTHHMCRHIAVIKRSGGRNNLSSVAVSECSDLRFEIEKWFRDENPAERGAVVRCHPTCSDHIRGHRRLVPSMGRLDKGTVRRVFRFQSSCRLPGGIAQRTY